MVRTSPFARVAHATPGADALAVDRVKRHFPGRAFLVTNSADIPKVLRGFLSTMVDR